MQCHEHLQPPFSYLDILQLFGLPHLVSSPLPSPSFHLLSPLFIPVVYSLTGWKGRQERSYVLLLSSLVEGVQGHIVFVFSISPAALDIIPHIFNTSKIHLFSSPLLLFSFFSSPLLLSSLLLLLQRKRDKERIRVFCRY